LPADVRRVDRLRVRAEDLSALHGELRHALDRVVLLRGEAARRPDLPVGRADDEGDQQRQGEGRHARDSAVHSMPRSAFARFETSISSASSRKFATTLDPPYETKGSVMPVNGIIRRMPPTMMNVWKANPNVRPRASSFENPSLASSEIRNPRITK